MELQNWEFESSGHKNGSCSTFSGESEENSTVNSEDEGVSISFKKLLLFEEESLKLKFFCYSNLCTYSKFKN